MLTGNNKLTREEFVGQIGHPRKEEMANMILDEATFEELEEKGFGRINVLEMAALISANMIDMQKFVVEVPEDESIVSAKDANANGAGEGDTTKGEAGTVKVEEVDKVKETEEEIATREEKENAEKAAFDALSPEEQEAKKEANEKEAAEKAAVASSRDGALNDLG